jgi:WD40 repeat protein/serine/threonine protein kinase
VTAPPDAPTTSVARLATALVRDQQRRWQAGDPMPVEAYLRQHPELAGDAEGLLDLICSEWALREQVGEAVVIDEYAGRFPDLEHSLRMQWEVHAVCRAMRREASGPTLSVAPSTTGLLARDGDVKIPDVRGYDLLEVLGHGGMGVVYKARHRGLDRLVALKMLRAGATADSLELARFQAEAEAVARLQHPNIVQIHDVGFWQPTDGSPAVPYLSLEFADGGNLAKRFAAGPMVPRAAAELLETLARAMHHAHQRGILHRDLKPANVLLQTADCRSQIEKQALAEPKSVTCDPLSAIPKITDFGLAKKLDTDSEQTRTGAVMGTPSYMAPEQADGRARHASPATDVYALGAILYEALTGRPPFKGTSVLDTLEQVKQLDPVVPRRLQPGVPRDLETICLKCLAKDPGRRYGSADALADDLRRFLDGKTIFARPTPAWEHAWKAVKRRPAVSVLTGLVIVATLIGFLGILAQWRRAERNADDHRHAAYDLAINLIQQEIYRDDTPRAQDLLESLKPRAGEADLRGFEWHYLRHSCHGEALTLPGRDCAAISPDGQVIAAGGEQGVIRIWNAAGAEIGALHGHGADVTALVFSPDGKLLVSTAKDNLVKVWDWQAGREKLHFPDGHTGWPLALATSLEGSVVASGGKDGAILVWNLATDKKQLELHSPGGEVVALAFHPDGRTLAAATTAEKVWFWDLDHADARPRGLDHAGVGSERGLAYSPDGRYLASAAGSKIIRLWNAATLEPVCDLQGHTGSVASLAFAPKGDLLVSGGWDRTIRVWDISSIPESVPQPLVLRGHRGWVTSLSIDGSGQLAVSAGTDRTARLWNLAAPRAAEVLASGGGKLACLAYSPDGRRLATGGPDKVVRIFDGSKGGCIELTGHPGHVNAVTFSPNGALLAAGDETGVIFVWDVANRRVLQSLRAPGQSVTGVAFSPDNRLVASSGWDGIVRLWDPASGEEVGALRGHDGATHAVAFSPDGRRLASAGADRTVRTWDVARKAELSVMCSHEDEVVCLAFDSTGKRLASGSKDRTVVVWDTESGRHLFVLPGHDSTVTAVFFDPADPRRLASAGARDGAVKLWDLDTRQELLNLPGCRDETTCLAYRPDGKELAAGGGLARRGQIRIWRGALDQSSR